MHGISSQFPMLFIGIILILFVIISIFSHASRNTNEAVSSSNPQMTTRDQERHTIYNIPIDDTRVEVRRIECPLPAYSELGTREKLKSEMYMNNSDEACRSCWLINTLLYQYLYW